MISWASPRPQSKGHHDRFSCFRTGDRRVSPYFTMGRPFPPKLPLPVGSETPSNMRFLGPIRVQNPNGISTGSSVFAQMTAECPYTLQRQAPFPSKLSLTTEPGGIWTPSNTWFPGPTRFLNPNGISIGSAVFAELTSVTDRQTTLFGR